MTRPSQNTDQKLIQVARRMLPTTGCAGLNLREVAQAAHVNLGMFHYHFKTKDEFVRRVLEDVYRDFLKEFNRHTLPTQGSAMKRLESALFELGRFGWLNRDLVVALSVDILSGNKRVAKFIGQLIQGHMLPIYQLFVECQSEGKFLKGPLAPTILQVALAINGPHLAVALLNGAGAKGVLDLSMLQIESDFADEEKLRKRVRSVLRMVSRKKIEG